MVQVVRMISIDDMHTEDIWFSWGKSSNHQEKLRCHARDERTDGRRTEDGKWKIVQCSVRPETAKSPIHGMDGSLYFFSSISTKRNSKKRTVFYRNNC